MTDTDLSNAVHLHAFLGLVDDHFEIFQTHEQIETTHILSRLLERIPPAEMKSLDNDIHRDHRLAKMRNLVGDLKLRLLSDESKIAECGTTLKTAIQQFAVDFFPHMDEEETVRWLILCGCGVYLSVCLSVYWSVLSVCPPVSACLSKL
jgi:hypothetical protein